MSFDDLWKTALFTGHRQKNQENKLSLIFILKVYRWQSLGTLRAIDFRNSPELLIKNIEMSQVVICHAYTELFFNHFIKITLFCVFCVLCYFPHKPASVFAIHQIVKIM